ncbi:MAG: AAA family ATPase [Methylovirgula sp.]
MTGTDSKVAADQAEVQAKVFAFLANPATYGFQDPTAKSGQHDARKVERIDTHGAALFLAGADVYKIKRAVCFPFMDFSSLEKRRAACENEIAVNRRNAPELYLGTVPIRRDAKGLHLGGAQGAIIEWAVHLRRFDETQTFDKLADRGALDLDLMADLAETIAAAHAHAPVGGNGATQMLRRRLEDTFDGLAAASEIFPAEEVGALRQDCFALFAAVEPRLIARQKAGCVRLCHGDLHLRNIVLYEGRPVLFDAIEFDDTIATCDILYDFAFVLMDLWQRGLHLHANRLFNLYLWRIRDSESALEGLPALPLFLALRAAIRARVTAALCRIEPKGREDRIAEAQHFFAAAQGFLEMKPARLIAIGGLAGSGKSTFAKELAPSVGRAPGAVHLRSDIERKRLFKIRACEKLPDDAYRAEITVQVYERLRQLASRALEAGHSVIIDAVHGRAEERDALASLAARINVAFTGFWLEAPAETLIARVEARTNDASDAKAAIVRAQLGWDLGPMRWQKLDATQPPAELMGLALKAIA